MLNKVLNILSFLLIIVFFYIIFSLYFSEKNIIKVNNNRLNIKKNFKEYSTDLPILLNDTNDTIFYNSEKILKNGVTKRKFWDLLDNNE